MREDIKRGLGCCLLDPSAGGSTAKRLVAYCAEQEKQNVLLISPSHTYEPVKKTVGLNPFKESSRDPELRQSSIDTLMRAIRALYGVKDPSEQSRIERYLPLVFTALYDAKRPLVDAVYFTHRADRNTQDEILSHTDSYIEQDIREALSTTSLQYNNFQSTITRLLRFTRGPLGKMFSVTQGVDWLEVIRNNWVVVVRLDKLDTFDARLLGTYIISELETAKERMNAIIDSQRNFKDAGNYPPFYLYADEAYLFASQSLKNILDLKQKMNFKVTLAHHTAKQFDDPAVYASIKTNCDMTVEFYVKSRADRDDIAREMYGGDIDPQDASYAHSNLSKQHAVIKNGKDNPVTVRLPDVPTPDISSQQLTNYILKLYQHHWYHDSDTIYQPTYATPPSNRNNSGNRAKNDPPPNNPNPHPGRASSSQTWTVVPEDLPGRKQHSEGNDKTKPKVSKTKPKK